MEFTDTQHTSWDKLPVDRMSELISRQMLSGDNGTLGRYVFARGAIVPRHSHVSEQYTFIVSGAVKFVFDDREVVLNGGDLLFIPANVPHSAEALEDAVDVDFFAPRREDLINREDAYVRDAQPASK